MTKAVIVTGDDATLLVTLKKNRQTFDIPNGTDVVAQIISIDHSVVYSTPVTQVSTTSGADWANSLLAVNFPSAVTAAIAALDGLDWKSGRIPAKLELQVDDGGKLTWFEYIDIVKGTIT